MTRILPRSVLPARNARTNSGSGNASGEWRKVYTLADMDSQEHIFAARTGNTSYEFFPEEIQDAFRVAYITCQGGGPSQQIVYDMTGGWVFNLRLIPVEEKPRWQDKMNE